MPDSLVEQFERLLDSGSVDVFSFLSSQRQLSTQDQLRVLLFDQQKRWMAGQPLKVEDYLAQLPEIASDLSAVLELAVAEYMARLSRGNAPDIEEFTGRFPQIADSLRKRIQHPQSPPPIIEKGISTETMIPDKVMATLLNGRYRKVRELGAGAFGQVYLAFDEDLQRQVAIKIPTAERFQRAQDADLFLSEARTVASLSHPHIVPVYDMGRTPEGAVFVVSRFIEGGTLKERLQSNRMSFEDSAQLLRTVANALHYAHQRRLIHRDVKPDNILIEASTNTPFVADFGLAIREEDYAKQLGVAGTPAYMSPEQARGEGHRLDCRSDVFSLGVILYELLTGQRPFRGSTPNEVLHQVVSVDPVPPRSVQEHVSAELERICLKAMSKQASDRYHNAAELADDLEAWLSPASRTSTVTTADVPVVPKGLRSFDAGDADFFLDLLPGPRNREGLPESISFWKQRVEQTDPEQTFSVGLIYGPSGCGKSSLVKAGLLPHLSKEVIAVYVEATPEDTEDRILRGLRKRVVSLATTGEPPGASRGSVFPPFTPAAKALRVTPAASAVPLMDSEAHERNQGLTTSATGLADMFAAVRRGTGPKVVIIIDQFEQWLHAHRAEPKNELVQALRHCDGGRLQAVVMIRDDFAMAAARLMDALDIPILQGVNFATVDLFDVNHAAKVLTKFGRAFQQLPSGSQPLTAEQEQFVSTVAEGLAQDGKVVSVRLALFAEMIKNKLWTLKTLKDVGGTEGIGVNFLEETFASRTANPKHRQHQAAARAVLKALLPEVGTDIKGHMRSHEELLEASGYHDRPSDFNELLRIVDGELRLMTPTDPEGGSLSGERQGVSPPSSSSTSPGYSPPAPRYFQLTHDYLVPSLREWLTRKQRETRRGRAELKLEERSALWNSMPENRFLPSLVEWLRIRTLTKSKYWTAPQRVMMTKAGRRHGIRSAIAVLCTCGLVAAGVGITKEVNERRNGAVATGLVDGLLTANTQQISARLASLQAFRAWADPQLKQAFKDSAAGSDARLHAGLALVAEGQSVDPTVLDFLQERLLDVTPMQFGPVRELLEPYKAELTPAYWQLAIDEQQPAARRFHAACALAAFDAKSTHHTPDPATSPAGWNNPTFTKFIAEQLVAVSPVWLSQYRELLRPVSASLVQPLTNIFKDPARGELARTLATSLLSDYAAKDPDTLTDLILEADAASDKMLFPVLQQHGQTAVSKLEAIVARRLTPDWHDAPLDASWTEPSPAVRTQIESAHGLMTDRVAFCQDMPWSRFTEVVETLRSSGYRPTRIRPYSSRHFASAAAMSDGPTDIVKKPVAEFRDVNQAGGTRSVPATLVSAIWVRDNKRWQLQTDVPKEQLPPPDVPALRDCLVPADVAIQPFADSAVDQTFVVLWSDPDSPEEQRRLLVDLSDRQLTTANANLATEGFVSQSTINVWTNDPSEHIPKVAPAAWNVKFYSWPNAGPQQPPADWQAVVASPPVLEQVLPDLAFSGLTGVAAPGVPQEYFAMEATAESEFAAGPYVLKTTFDDGVRIYVDDRLIVDHWSFNHPTTDEVEFTVTEGRHNLRVEYFQITGGFTLSVEVASADVGRRFAGIWSNRGALSELNAGYRGFERIHQPQWDVAVTGPPRVPLNDPLEAFQQQLAEIENLPPEQLDDPLVREKRATANYQLGNLEPALADLEFLLKQASSLSFTVLQYHTLTLARLNRAEEAKESLTRFLASDAPDSYKNYVQIQLPGWLGEFELASELLESSVRESASDVNDLYNMSCAAALLSHGAEPKAHSHSQKLRDRTIDLLRQIVVRGFNNVQQLKSDPDFGSLHADPRFLALIEELEPQANYAAVWRADVKLEAKLLTQVLVDDVVDQLKPLLAEGYRPFAIAIDARHSTQISGLTPTARQGQIDVVVGLIPAVASPPNNPLCSIVLHRPIIPDAAKEQLALQQAAAATALLRLDAADQAWPLLKHSPDPRIRSYLIHRLGPFGVDPLAIIQRLRHEPDISIRRALVLSLGEYDDLQLSQDVRQGFVSKLQEIYRTDPDPGLHAAAEWLLRTWHFQPAAIPAASSLEPAPSGTLPHWSVNTQGQTMVIFPGPVEFVMGSAVSESSRESDEVLHRRRIDRKFAIATKAVTLEQYRKFDKQYELSEVYTRMPELPVVGVSWYMAASYCNWLSKEEGLAKGQWCYEIRSEEDISLTANYLSLTGYRLPTEAEMEYAMRAGAMTARYFGETDHLLPKYAWHNKNSQELTWPVGSLKPNDFGLFDASGNVWAWCQDSYAEYPQGVQLVDDKEGDSVVTSHNARVLRGGSFFVQSSNLRSADRNGDQPDLRSGDIGFRLARTLPPVPLTALPPAEGGRNLKN